LEPSRVCEKVTKGGSTLTPPSYNLGHKAGKKFEVQLKQKTKSIREDKGLFKAIAGRLTRGSRS